MLKFKSIRLVLFFIISVPLLLLLIFLSFEKDVQARTYIGNQLPVNKRITKTESEWRKLLSPDRFEILRNRGTERAFSGGLLYNKKKGVYICAACGHELFFSGHKFESGTGWPSFYQPISKQSVYEKTDYSYNMIRQELVCARCDSHLGHVFGDGPEPTGLRYCINSLSLRFIEVK